MAAAMITNAHHLTFKNAVKLFLYPDSIFSKNGSVTLYNQPCSLFFFVRYALSIGVSDRETKADIKTDDARTIPNSRNKRPTNLPEILRA